MLEGGALDDRCPGSCCACTRDRVPVDPAARSTRAIRRSAARCCASRISARMPSSSSSLPAAGWTLRRQARSPSGYRYRGAGSVTDPCRSVVVDASTTCARTAAARRSTSRCRRRRDLRPARDRRRAASASARRFGGKTRETSAQAAAAPQRAAVDVQPATTRPLRAVLWDLDGVLIDSYEVWFHLLNATSRAFGGIEISRAGDARRLGAGHRRRRRAILPAQDRRRDRGVLPRALHGARAPPARRSGRARGDRRAAASRLRAGADHEHALAARARDPRTPPSSSSTTWSAAPTCRTRSPRPTWCARPAADSASRASEALVVGDSRYDLEAARGAGVTSSACASTATRASSASATVLLRSISERCLRQP